MRTDRTARLSPIAAALALVLAPTAHAGIILVTNNSDSGTGSLREAITNANLNCSGDTAPAITFNGAFTIALASPLPTFFCGTATYNPSIDAFTYGGTIMGPAGGASCGLEYVHNFVYGGSFTVKGLTVKNFNSGAFSSGICGTSLNLFGNTITGNTVGIRAQSGVANHIGGSAANERNFIGNNSDTGIHLTGQSTVENNFVGTLNGTTAAPNGTGIYMGGSSDHTVTGNVISGNSGAGIHIYGDYGGSMVSANLIGTKDGGAAKLGNGGGGVFVEYSSGPSIFNNIIGGNSVAGIDIYDSAIFVSGNFIGVNPGGTALANTVGINAFCSGYFGIQDNTIGNNQSHGINLQNTDAVFVSGNFIAANGGSGVRLASGADCGFGGEANELEDNTIEGNSGSGVLFQGGLGNPIGNRIIAGTIQGNAGKNINLSGAATLPNDPGDTDSGNNRQQNWPVITSVVQTDGVTIVDFTLDSSFPHDYRIQAYSNASMGKPGGTYRGETTICGDCSEFSGQVVLDGLYDNISLTATDEDLDDTSEFSPVAAASTAPAVSISQTTLNFGNIQVGNTSTQQTALLRSMGDQPWVISTIDSSGLCYGGPICYGGGFICSTTCTTETEYAKGQTCQVKASFAPNFTGFQSTTVNFCDNTGAGINTITLQGTGVPPPPIAISPTFWDFGSVPVGGTSEPHGFTITNTTDYGGTLPIVIQTTGEFDIVADDCGGSVSTESPCHVLVNFGPTTGGEAQGELRVSIPSLPPELLAKAEAFTPTLVVVAKATLAGNGLAGGELVLPGDINVGSAAFGGQAISTTVEIRNNGTTAVNIASIGIAGPFTLVNNCPAVLEPAQACTLTIGFAAPGVGPFTGTLTVVSDSGSAEIPVTAQGQTALTPLLRVQPTSMGFGDRLIGSASTAQQVTITNIGGAPATVALNSSTIDFLISGNGCPATLEPNVTCTASIAFRPLGFGTRTGSLVVTSNAPNSPQAVTLGGTGCRPFFASGNRIGDMNNCAP